MQEGNAHVFGICTAEGLVNSKMKIAAKKIDLSRDNATIGNSRGGGKFEVSTIPS